MNATVLERDDPRLREVSREVPRSYIGGAYLNDVIERMKAALRSEEDSAAIAAPQIGENIRMFIISEKILTESSNPRDLIFINPRITKRSKKTQEVEEGCLSVRWLYGYVTRHEKVAVEALDENGKPFTYGGSGLVAQAFQHEIDHLDGVLFIDKATNIRDLPPHEHTDHEHTE